MPPTFSDLQAPVAPVDLARARRALVTPARRHTYGQILKSSALMGGSTVANIAVSVVRAKAMALLLVDRAGTRLSDLAQRATITKQAMMQLVDDLQEMGCVRRVPDPQDARAKTVRLTAKPPIEMGAAPAGIRMIFQEQTVANDLTVAQNIFLGIEPERAPGILDKIAAVK